MSAATPVMMTAAIVARVPPIVRAVFVALMLVSFSLAPSDESSCPAGASPAGSGHCSVVVAAVCVEFHE